MPTSRHEVCRRIMRESIEVGDMYKYEKYQRELEYLQMHVPEHHCEMCGEPMFVSECPCDI